MSDREWDQLKCCQIPMDRVEILQTGRQLVAIQNAPMIRGFVKLTAEILEQAGEDVLLAELKRLSQPICPSPAIQLDLEEQLRTGEAVLTEDVEKEISSLSEEVSSDVGGHV